MARQRRRGGGRHPRRCALVARWFQRAARRDSGDRPEPTAGIAILECHQRSSIASVVTTSGITVVARQGGRTQVLDATHTLFGTLASLETAHAIRLSPADALLLVSDGLVSDPGGLGAPLGLAAVESPLHGTTHHRGDELIDQLLVLARRHPGGRRLAPTLTSDPLRQLLVA